MPCFKWQCFQEDSSDDHSRLAKLAPVSGGDASSQLQAEVKLLSDDERKELLGEIGLPVVIPTDHALAMKADLSLPWTKLRVFRR